MRLQEWLLILLVLTTWMVPFFAMEADQVPTPHLAQEKAAPTLASPSPDASMNSPCDCTMEKALECLITEYEEVKPAMVAFKEIGEEMKLQHNDDSLDEQFQRLQVILEGMQGTNRYDMSSIMEKMDASFGDSFDEKLEALLDKVTEDLNDLLQSNSKTDPLVKPRKRRYLSSFFGVFGGSSTSEGSSEDASTDSGENASKDSGEDASEDSSKDGSKRSKDKWQFIKDTFKSLHDVLYEKGNLVNDEMLFMRNLGQKVNMDNVKKICDLLTKMHDSDDGRKSVGLELVVAFYHFQSRIDVPGK